MPDQPPLDIAKLDNWFGLRPGMTRTQVTERLQQLGAEEDPYSDDNVATTINGFGVEFFFAMDGSERLRQISLDGDHILWNGRELLGGRLDAALQAMGPLGRTPMWQANDATAEAFPDAGSIPTAPVPDEQLLGEGTLWQLDRGLGLVICAGEVISVAWREACDLPTQFAGPLTEAQRELSKRPDLEAYIRQQHLERDRAATPKNPLTPFYVALVLVCAGMLVLIGKRGIHEIQLWDQAPTLSGKFVSMEDVPLKKYLDLAPEAVRRRMPDDPHHSRRIYHIVYLDPSGRRQSAALESGELYVPPREPGEEVQVAYVDGDPPQVKGLARARDSAFLDCFPLAIGVGIFYFVGRGVIAFAPRLLRLVARAVVPKVGVIDPSRPELR